MSNDVMNVMESDFYKRYRMECKKLREECDEAVRNGEMTEEEAEMRYDFVKDEILMAMEE